MIERPADLANLNRWKDKDVIKVITGVRRCGKSTLMGIFKQNLIDNGINEVQTQTINFEDPKYSAFTSWRDVYDHINANLATSKKTTSS